MSELVQQLLGLTRMQHGTDRYPMREGDLSEFTESCCEEFMPADSRGITLKTDIAPGVTARFSGTLIVTGRISEVESALRALRDYCRDTLGFTVCEITKT